MFHRIARNFWIQQKMGRLFANCSILKRMELKKICKICGDVGIGMWLIVLIFRLDIGKRSLWIIGFLSYPINIDFKLIDIGSWWCTKCPCLKFRCGQMNRVVPIKELNTNNVQVLSLWPLGSSFPSIRIIFPLSNFLHVNAESKAFIHKITNGRS